MSPYVYLLFGDRDELTGLEQAPRADDASARREAVRLLQIDRETREVEIWCAGQRVGSVVDAGAAA